MERTTVKEKFAEKVIKDIFDTYGITATAGIGTNMYLAKIALDITAKHSASNIGYLDEEKFKDEKVELPEEIIQIVEERKSARINKDWQKSDELRDKLNFTGIIMTDDLNMKALNNVDNNNISNSMKN